MDGILDNQRANIMLAVNADRPGNPDPLDKMQRKHDTDFADRKIPTTVDEFIELEGLVSSFIKEVFST